MLKKYRVVPVVLAVFTAILLSGAAYADPGNGNGNHGNSGNHGYKGGNASSSTGQSAGKQNSQKNNGKPDHVESDISFSDARRIAVNLGLTGYPALPPGIAKNLARGKPIPPGIAKKMVPASMLSQLPYYPGYEWRSVGDDLVLVALGTAIVTSIINGVFH